MSLLIICNELYTEKKFMLGMIDLIKQADPDQTAPKEQSDLDLPV